MGVSPFGGVVVPGWWYYQAPPPTLLEKIRDGLREAASGLGLFEFIAFVEEVAPLMPPIVTDAGQVAEYVDTFLGDRNAHQILRADGDASRALYVTARDTLLTMLSTGTGSIIADELLERQDIDLRAAAAAHDLPGMLKALSRSAVSDLASDNDYQIADFALSFVEVATTVIDEAVRPDGRLGAVGAATDIISIVASAARTFTYHFDSVRAQAINAVYPDTYTNYAALQRLAVNLQAVSDALTRLNAELM
ncbi:hypothetical protein HXX76_002482 [Chlamydomonas incerta]|uniref:Uncharacterized protein n=1 Tax=Chlamydomonas incerta TaxID=51695 RepID=A0A835TE42_CHLIN|nr:hypothetical protein HXX76_002482 [Chlamydomonas incerta]|eukprot:KAG2442396.1 hypothetical protein HXX76_002482 [Chlamydomonas incerta]